MGLIFSLFLGSVLQADNSAEGAIEIPADAIIVCFKNLRLFIVPLFNSLVLITDTRNLSSSHRKSLVHKKPKFIGKSLKHLVGIRIV